MSILGRLHGMKAELSEGEIDPWRRALERALPGDLRCTSTVALLALLDFPVTTWQCPPLSTDHEVNGLGRDQIPKARTGRVAQHRVPRLGSSRPHHEIVPNDLLPKL